MRCEGVCPNCADLIRAATVVKGGTAPGIAGDDGEMLREWARWEALRLLRVRTFRYLKGVGIIEEVVPEGERLYGNGGGM